MANRREQSDAERKTGRGDQAEPLDQLVRAAQQFAHAEDARAHRAAEFGQRAGHLIGREPGFVVGGGELLGVPVASFALVASVSCDCLEAVERGLCLGRAAGMPDASSVMTALTARSVIFHPCLPLEGRPTISRLAKFRWGSGSAVFLPSVAALPDPPCRRRVDSSLRLRAVASKVERFAL